MTWFCNPENGGDINQSGVVIQVRPSSRACLRTVRGLMEKVATTPKSWRRSIIKVQKWSARTYLRNEC